MAPSAATAPSAASPSALEACEQVKKAGIGTLCESKPAPPAVRSAAQLTMPKPPGYEREIYAGFFEFSSAPELDQMLTAFKSEKNGAARKPSIFMTNAKALMLVGVDGEIVAKDAEKIRKVVDAL